MSLAPSFPFSALFKGQNKFSLQRNSSARSKGIVALSQGLRRPTSYNKKSPQYISSTNYNITQIKPFFFAKRITPILLPLQPHPFLNNNYMYSLFSTASHSLKVAQTRSYNSKGLTQGGGTIINNKLNPAFITGFVDAEGSFMALFRKKTQGYNNVGWRIETVFQIKLHIKDVKLLELILDYFGAGKIVKDGDKACALVIRSLNDIRDKVLPHFSKYPLKTQKLADYLLWKEIVTIMGKGDHLTKNGVQNIINLRASLNLGLSDTLNLSFPNSIAVPRPEVELLPLNISSLTDCEWVAGFTSGEGSFIVKIKESLRSKVGFQTYLDFRITQHSRDEKLMVSLINFFECGQYKLRGKGTLPAGDYYCVKFSDISGKIVPFFQKHVVRGVKSGDFTDWCKVVDFMQKGAHTTQEGLDIIRQIKSGMNRGREWK